MTLSSQLLQGFIRTVVPAIVSLITAWLVRKGIDPEPYRDALTAIIGAAIGGLYWLAVRLLEEKWPAFGALLGSVGKPTYQAPAAKDAESPTGVVATTDTPGAVIPGEPVVVEPADPDGAHA